MNRLVARHPSLRPALPALVVLGLAIALGACGDARPAARVNEPAPAISGATLSGETLDLAALRGRPVLVNFWASWCGPCRDEFPLFADELAGRAADGFAIVGVLYKDDASLAAGFIDEFGATWPTVVDEDGSIAAAYNVVAPPQSYFIDGEGVLRGIQIGQILDEDFATQYAKIAP